MNGRALPTYAVFDDYRYSQRVAVVVRWFLLVGFLSIHNYRADPDVPWLINNGLALLLCGLNGYVHWWVWKGRQITLPYVLTLSALDMTFITVGILATSRFDNTFFVLYYPAIVGLAVVAPSRLISFGGVVLVAGAYSVVSIVLEPQIDFGMKEERVLFIRLISMFAVVAAGNLVVSIERQRRREAVDAEREQAERALELERKAREAEEAAREERDKIARDIHDGIAQSIYALNLSIEGAAELAEQQGGAVSDRLRALVPLSKKTLLETRHYIHDLRPLLAGSSSFHLIAKSQTREFESVAGTPTVLTVSGQPVEVSAAVATGLYRILQEALANVLKHAQASRVDVAVTFRPASVALSVKDDGVGFDANGHAHGYGLDNMRERADELDGSFEISGGPGRGMVIEVALPVKGNEL